MRKGVLVLAGLLLAGPAMADEPIFRINANGDGITLTTNDGEEARCSANQEMVIFDVKVSEEGIVTLNGTCRDVPPQSASAD